ncbi:20342_t:CDS:1 [Cetraspora pellucida]|uniref:20342_t:CDS:1 n=1 Tax=Cetraspora pellucida TaxID=1433469 RepID=A0A9N9JX82_9GLOM|nr:20342_t:CDS:1 [Cetraspora pellucida]
MYNSIINTLNEMPETSLKSTSHLLYTIRYLYRKNKDQIIFSYIQNKAYQYISNSFYKSGKSLKNLTHQNKQLKQNVKKLQQSKDHIIHKVQQLNGSVVQLKCKQHQYISQIHAIAKHLPELKANDMKAVIKNLIMQNNKEYNLEFIKLITQVSQIEQTSFATVVTSIKTIFNFLTGNNT